eukprot:Filipodium_phascolosomae@DN4711_c0_g1_i1.p1
MSTTTNENLLAGKVCAVTGATRGIGRAIAVRMAAEGAKKVIIIGRNETELSKTEKECLERNKNVEVRVMAKSDFSDPKQVDECADALVKEEINVLVNNAGVLKFPNDVVQHNPADIGPMLNINVHAPIALVHKIAPQMVARKEGTIINIGSDSAYMTLPAIASYGATKHALKGWHHNCYAELRKHGVKCTLVNPAATDTDMTDAMKLFHQDKLIRVEDVAECCMLPFRTSAHCCPVEINLLNTVEHFK